MKNVRLWKDLGTHKVEYLATTYQDSSGAEGAEPYTVREVTHILRILDERGVDILKDFDQDLLEDMVDSLSQGLKDEDFL